MFVNATKQLHWTQRVALVRHNIHSASRSGGFTFFKTLQAAAFIEGTNHAATLSAALGDEADPVMSAIDNLNAGLAQIHEDAFKNIYDNLKDSMRDENATAGTSKLHVDITMQKNMADMAIDKVTSSAIALINVQPEEVQDAAANVWITGATIVADTVEIALREMDSLEHKMHDFIRLEESWNTVRASVAGSISGLKGVYSLMDTSRPASTAASEKPSSHTPSLASASGAMFRRLSNAFHATGGPSPSPSRQTSISSATSAFGSTNSASVTNLISFARNGSVGSLNNNHPNHAAPVYRTPNYVRNSVSTGCPTSMPAGSPFEHHKLSMVPPTPAYDGEADPFDTSVPPMPEIPVGLMSSVCLGSL